MIEILMYLFENYMNTGTRLQQPIDQVSQELQRVGFPVPAIEGAFDWLSDLNDLDQSVDFETNRTGLIRCFSAEEQRYLDVECQRFLVYLLQANIITLPVCEIIIDRVLALGQDDVSLSKIKWVTLMVLYSRPSEQHALLWVQDVILNADASVSH